MKIYKIASIYNSRDYGSWIAPSGKLYPVIDYQGHALELMDIFPKEGLQGSHNLMQAKGSDEEGLDAGFVRVVNVPLIFQYNVSPTIEQQECIMNLIIECPYEDDIWITAYFKTSVFKKKEDIGRIEKFLRL